MKNNLIISLSSHLISLLLHLCHSNSEKIKTEQCVFENLEKCDELTSLAVTRRLEEVLSNWKHLKCPEPEDQLKDCKDVFETRTYAMFGMNKNDVWTAFEKNNTDL